MGIGLWKKNRIIRRFKDADNHDGYTFQKREDFVVKCDVQTTDGRATMGDDGDRFVQHLKVYSNDVKLRPADKNAGTTGDLLWYQGKWFECRGAVLFENSFLRHWECDFVEALKQGDPPDEEGLLNGNT